VLRLFGCRRCLQLSSHVMALMPLQNPIIRNIPALGTLEPVIIRAGQALASVFPHLRLRYVFAFWAP
jgi:hypothetical protein